MALYEVKPNGLAPVAPTSFAAEGITRGEPVTSGENSFPVSLDSDRFVELNAPPTSGNLLNCRGFQAAY